MMMYITQFTLMSLEIKFACNSLIHFFIESHPLDISSASWKYQYGVVCMQIDFVQSDSILGSSL